MTIESIKKKLSYIVPLFFIRLFHLFSYLRGKKVLYLSVALPLQRVKPYNWGDDVSIVLTEMISGKTVIPHQFSFFNKNKENYLCVGSILQWYTNRNSIVWGSGLIEDTVVSDIPKKVVAVRGPLTRNSLLKQGIDCPEVYGDPVLLFPKFYVSTSIKKYDLGIICHFTELHNDELMARINFYVKSNHSVLFIDISNYGKWNDFIDKVCACRAVVSSSLHGVIVSDAYSVPNKWIGFVKDDKEKKEFKFDDYYLSVGKSVCRPDIFNFSIKPEVYKDDVCREWTRPSIDLDSLFDCCPFRK